MGNALWEFLWIVEHVTEEYVNGRGETRGKVLGGAVIPAERIAQDYTDADEGISVSPDTVRNHLAALDKAGYIACRRGTNGFHIEVRHSKKWPQRFSMPDPSPLSNSEVSTLGDSACPSIGDSEIRRVDKTAESSNPQIVNSPIASNDGTGTEDNAEHNVPTNIEGAAEFERWWTAAVTQIVGKAQGSKALAAAFGACARRLVENDVIVWLPADPQEAQLVRRFIQSLQGHLRVISGRPLRVTLPSAYMARDGPSE
jgi:DNA-binding transcriptional ArsR family regulator